MGACLEAYDLYYGTPLHVACVNEHIDCVKVLLNAGEQSRMTDHHQTKLLEVQSLTALGHFELKIEFYLSRILKVGGEFLCFYSHASVSYCRI